MTPDSLFDCPLWLLNPIAPTRVHAEPRRFRHDSSLVLRLPRDPAQL